MKNICVFGDSITWGAFDTEKGGWAERLKIRAWDYDGEVCNLGISGDTSSEVLSRFSQEIRDRQAEVVIFAIGINDSLFRQGDTDDVQTKPEQFEQNMRKLITRAHEVHCTVVCVGLTLVEESKTIPVPWSTTGKSYCTKNVEQYDNILKTVTQDTNTIYIDVLHVLDADDLEDGVHPNSEGHRKLSEHIVAELEAHNLLG